MYSNVFQHQAKGVSDSGKRVQHVSIWKLNIGVVLQLSGGGDVFHTRDDFLHLQLCATSLDMFNIGYDFFQRVCQNEVNHVITCSSLDPSIF